MSTPPPFLRSVYDKFPDDEEIKTVSLQADGQNYSGFGDRHVLLWWQNGTREDKPVTQIVQLTGQDGNYAYYSANVLHETFTTNHLQISLGDFTRAQRDQILQLAKDVQFVKTSTVNGCRAWTEIYSNQWLAQN